VVGVYSDAGVQVQKTRAPDLDRMLSDASCRKFDVVMALEAGGVDLYLDQQATSPR
jgi:hypothetical protein